MLKPISRMYNDDGSWTEDTIECANKLGKMIQTLVDEYKDKFSPDELLALSISELHYIISRTIIKDKAARILESYENSD